jgi:3-methyladenine DNA glycosylase AlkD
MRSAASKAIKIDRRKPPPSVPSVLAALRAAGTARKRASAIRVGIPMDKAFGVPVGAVRAIARQLRGQHALADPLWATGVHEARLLSVLLTDPRAVTRSRLERRLDDVISWDLCDHLCGDLIRFCSNAMALPQRWAPRQKLYVKRAAFALIAEFAVHAPNLDDDTLAGFVRLVITHSDDPRPHVRQAASWALRSIGKRDPANHDRALVAASELAESSDPAKRWVGRDALRELTTLKKVPERKRLLRAKSKMGQQQ